jgi:small-conductance mechanosensitive channel
VIGDWLRIDDCEGTVEHIGIKSTRLRSVSGEQIILSNADVLKSRVRNLGRMPERRALFTLGLTYATAATQLERVPLVVREAVQAVPGTRFEYCLLRGFGESALNFEVCYFVPDPRARQFLEILDRVNRGILQRFATDGIEFAYPTRTLYSHPPR